MRAALLILPIAALAAPGLAQTAPAPQAVPAPTAPEAI